GSEDPRRGDLEVLQVPVGHRLIGVLGEHVPQRFALIHREHGVATAGTLQSGEVERLVIGHGDSSWTGAGDRTVDEGGTAWSDEMSGGGRLVAQEGIERSAIRDP